MEMDLLSMWIRGQYDELFAALKAMPFEDRIREYRRLCQVMRDFDEDNSDEETQTDELLAFQEEAKKRL